MSTPDLAALWNQLGWQPTAEQQEQFQALQQQLRLWNSRLNLTRLVDGDDFWIAQVYDSLWPLQSLLHGPDGASKSGATDAGWAPAVIDVGTGGGFPGLAVAIALPMARLCLVDSVQRKVEAVRAMAAALGLNQRVTLCAERIEKLGQQRRWRGQFDWALARAVAPAPVVAEYLVPLLKPTGRALLYRGQWSSDDQQQLDAACSALKAGVEIVQACTLPNERGQRHAITLKPEAACPRQYPRAIGIPAKQPLGSSGPGQVAPDARRRR